MATIRDTTGASIHRGQLEQRPTTLTVTGIPDGEVWLTVGRDTELGRGLAGQSINVDLAALPLGTAYVTARGDGWSPDTKTVEIIPVRQPGLHNTGPQIPDDELTPWADGVIRTDIVLDRVLITDPLVIRGANVILTRSTIRCGRVSGELVVDVRDGGRLLMEDCELDGLGTARIGIGYAGVTVRRCNIHHVNDGARLSSNTVLEDSWVHDLSRIVAGGEVQHPDCVQVTGGRNVTVQGNTLTCMETDGGMGNACLQVNRTSTSDPTDLLLENNWLDGGNYSVNVQAECEGAITVRDNKWSGQARYGFFLGPQHVEVVNNVGADDEPAGTKRTR